MTYSKRIEALLQNPNSLHELVQEYDALKQWKADRPKEDHEIMSDSIFTTGPVTIIQWFGMPDENNFHPVQQVTANVEAILGYTRQEMLDRVVEYGHLVHPEDLAQVLENLKIHHESSSEKAFTDEYRIIKKDGSIIWVSDHTQMVRNESGEVTELVGYLSDITTQVKLRNKAAQNELARKLAETANQSKSEFLANMSHEIRTPLNGIMGMAQVLAVSEVPDESKEYVDIILRSSQSLLTIINDILDFSKIESGAIELDPQPFPIRHCVEDVASLLATAAQDTGIDLIVNISPELPEVFLGDAGRIRQILMNLLGNALKFTTEGHVLVDVSGKTENAQSHLMFNIVDTGIGIAPDKLAKIFDQFSQADNTTTRIYGGTGLGLSISKRLAQLMGGDLVVESVLGAGSTFTFTVSLPVVIESGQQDRPQSKPVSGNILIIDDNLVNQEVLSAQLSSSTCNCVCVGSVMEGLLFLDKACSVGAVIDMVIVDYQMPERNGEDFIREMRAQSKFDHIPVIMLSSVAPDGLKDHILELGAAAYMTKPARIVDLRNNIALTMAQTSDALSGKFKASGTH